MVLMRSQPMSNIPRTERVENNEYNGIKRKKKMPRL